MAICQRDGQCGLEGLGHLRYVAPCLCALRDSAFVPCEVRYWLFVCIWSSSTQSRRGRGEAQRNSRRAGSVRVQKNAWLQGGQTWGLSWPPEIGRRGHDKWRYANGIGNVDWRASGICRISHFVSAYLCALRDSAFVPCVVRYWPFVCIWSPLTRSRGGRGEAQRNGGQNPLAWLPADGVLSVCRVEPG